MKIGLIGNQNSGKSSLYNKLTNSNQMVGNWAGVTVSKHSKKLNNIEIIDLPGIYSINSFTKDEKITIDYLHNIDIIVNVIDGTNLYRSLYLTLQLMELKKRMIIVITKKDICLKNKTSIDYKLLSEYLNIPVIMLSKDSIDSNIVENIKKARISDLSLQTPYLKYKFIDKIHPKIVKENKKRTTLDKIILNKYLSIPIFILIIFLMYYLSFNSVSIYISDVINALIDHISNMIYKLTLPKFIKDLITNGILNGIGVVISFIPSLLLLYLFLTILEESGYMSRISFIMDKLFRKIGLNGKSIIPFIIGTSCSVPAIMSARTIENKGERYLTSMMTSLIPCSAKMTIIMLFTKMIFKRNLGFHIFLIYLISILVIILMSFILKKYIFKQNLNYYLNEISELQLPNLKNIVKTVYRKIIDFVIRITKTVILSSIIIWFLYSINFNFQYTTIENSILGIISNKVSIVFYPILGKNSYECTMAIFQGIIAKEQVISSLLVSSKLQGINVIDLFPNNISIYSFLIFNLFCFPCINSIITLKKEIGLKLTVFNVLFQTIIAFIISALIYQIGIILL